MFDTHCHLNFHCFEENVETVIRVAFDAGIKHIVVPGTDVVSSKRAIEIASSHEGVYAAVGIHPHHVFQYQTAKEQKAGAFDIDLAEIEKLIAHKKVVAVGEIGLDKHYYEKTKYSEYQINSGFLTLQKEVFVRQIELAKKYGKSLILHNREAKEDFLEALGSIWDKSLEGRAVFHCCEPDDELLSHAKDHDIFIGVDGDVTYSAQKRGFAQKIPLDMLVLETDSPFLLPEPYRSYPKDKKLLNTPERIKDIGLYIANLKNISAGEVFNTTSKNAQNLFGFL